MSLTARNRRLSHVQRGVGGRWPILVLTFHARRLALVHGGLKTAFGADKCNSGPRAMFLFLDEEISLGWCLGMTWRCTPVEAIGLWSVVLFYMTLILGTIIHAVTQTSSNEEVTTRRRNTPTDAGDEWVLLCSFMIYFFSFAAGCLVWALAGVQWVHPVQIWQVQLTGAAALVTCTFLFIVVHINMGANWSPEPDGKAPRQLVTHGVFRWARHPMYAVFLWGAISTLLATLNWLIAWCVFGSVMIVLRRIETEERILVGLFGGQYLEYRSRVSALGFPWRCLGFDRHG